ncbi:hypothetical protein HF325_000083 [Metschnikowia pulcherrima]|uniref:Ribosomal RNA-processing protein 1 n=1 Tax=Metschnikowia pulcherrima TaxID=27326 RepID=A0A8H7GYJ2_9ASCO|nr:hypothetical protein HF325_000083 [Metschnikowia pulcherrima]
MVKESSAFVRKLAHNDPATRKAAFDSLTNYLQSPAGARLRFLDLEKLWKGLYFSMWYCDKPVPQQNLAGNLGELFSKVIPQEKLADFHRAFWAVFMREWHLIDKWRLDKFLMLVRRVLRHNFFRLCENGWKEQEVAEFVAVLEEYPLMNNMKFPQSLTYHICDIYLDELEYVVFKEFREYSEESEDSEESADSGSDDDSDSDSEDENKAGKADKTGEKPAGKTQKLSEEEISEKKATIIAQTPVKALVAPFEKVAETLKNKALREKCKEDLLDDKRLQTWAVVDGEESESEDEWTGF